MPGFGNAIGIPFIRRKLSGLRAKFRGDGTITAMLDPILRDLSADFVSNGTITAALETIKLLDADFSGEGTVTGELLDFTGLLDDYPNAAAAYSVRLLRADYTGGLVEIRRSSDNATKAFLPDSNNELSLSSEAVVGSQTLSAFIGSNDGFVVTWYDQSGNSNDATQSTASDQPQIISSGSLILENGKPAIDFAGGTKFLTLTNQLSTPLSVFIVLRDNGANSFPYVYGNSVGGTSDVLALGFVNTTVRNFVSGTIVSYNDTNYIGNQSLFTSIMDSSNAFLGRNGVLGTSGTNSGTSSRSELRIGSAVFSAGTTLDGVIQEIVQYDNNQSSNRTGIETNQNDFFSIY